ncbi:MAG: thioredoxin domain-containing protein [Candidatus Lokiarchaeota archaeon]|nr:thioredoxin domain-containing protein [Candidatus Lokiarchaeota archaeon]
MNENRLARETSPYLLQHACNPVDWYPWGAEAFEKARREDKPVFLSIGYSTCHWCHVMEHESFEDEATARVLNEHFVAIKVDREERPDVDAAYMNFVVATTGSGGWPMSVFTTPDGKPFLGGTYFPNRPRHGLPSFKDLLLTVAKKYEDEKDGLLDAASRMAEALRESVKKRVDGPSAAIDARPVDAFNDAFIEPFDYENGGLVGTPKFPITLEVIFNLHQRKNVPEALLTLRRMSDGGIFDHLEGGFHRYSVDERWIVPHFEKMLYDNALLLEALSKAYLVSGDDYFKEKAAKTYGYLVGRMLSDRGFYAAQDADSEGEEGRYYVFTHDELKGVVEHFELFKKYYGITERGNFDGKNILVADSELPGRFTAEELGKIRLDEERLREFRAKRVPPSTDTKIITAWNGLALSGIAWFGIACGRPDAIDLATRIAGEYVDAMVSRGTVFRIAGKDTIPGFLDDYAALASGLFDVYEASHDPRFIDAAKKVAGWAIEQFHDGEGHFTQSGARNERLFSSDNRVHDGVTPSGTSLAAWALFKLHAATADQRYADVVEKVLKAHHDAMLQRPTTIALLVQVLWSFLGNHHVITVPSNLATRETISDLMGMPAANRTIIVSPNEGNVMAVCSGTVCGIASTVGEVRSLLGNVSGD